MSRKNNKQAKQRRHQHMVREEKAERERQQKKLERRKSLNDVTRLLDSCTIDSHISSKKYEKAGQPALKSTIYSKVRSIRSSGAQRSVSNDMELDGPSKSHVFGGARTLKAIIKNKGVIGAKTGGTGVRRGTATVSLNPKKPNKPCRSVLQTKEVSPKEVPSRFKNIVKRMNKRKRKGAVVV